MKNHPSAFAFAALILLAPLCRAQTPPTYAVTTFAGNNVAGYSGDGAAATAAELDGPTFLMLDSKGNLYVSDQFNNVIRMVAAGGNISTAAGSALAGYAGDGAAATSARLYTPAGTVLDSKGNLYIADSHNNVVRMVAPGGTISTVAGNYNNGSGFGGDNGPATFATMSGPTGLAIDSAGNLYIADTGNHRVRKVSNGTITTFAGTGFAGFRGDGGPPTLANLDSPRALALDANGTLYIADSNSNNIRKIAGGVISTVAGSSSGTGGFSGEGGQAGSALLQRPNGVAVDSCGNLYIADTFNNRIRMVTTSGVISTIAGAAATGYTGDGGPGLSARFYFPAGVTVDSTGKVYVADTQNNVVRLLTPGAAPACGGSQPSIKSGGVVSASDYGQFSSIAPGSWIEIYGSNLAASTRSWTAADFNGVNAPPSLDRTAVTIGGQSAFIDYISAVQVNAQVPSNIGSGPLSLTVSTATGTSAAYTVNVNLTQPGLYAPALFNAGGKQYAAATFTDGKTYVAPPGAIPGITSRQAKPGETIILYGVGFGTVNTGIPAGQIVLQSNTLTLPITIFFGGTPATLQYSGLAGNFVGLYEFYAVVPNIADSDAVPLTFTLNGVSGTQTLYTAVHQ